MNTDFSAMEKQCELRDATAGDFEAICALNLVEVQHTSTMDIAQLTLLDRLACFHQVACVAGTVTAFLLAIASGAAYVNSNFAWFTDRYPRFVYIDRVVVASTSKGLRLGSLLYEELFRFARRNQFPLVTCEFNIDPPNEPSRLFHQKFGFSERGTQWVKNQTKRVSMQAASVTVARDL